MLLSVGLGLRRKRRTSLPSLINIKLTYYLIAELSRALSARSETSWVGEFPRIFRIVHTYVPSILADVKCLTY